MNVSVKVMKSYDYCHFEVQLSDEAENAEKGIQLADELGKVAQILADNQIDRYKRKKLHMEQRNPFANWQLERMFDYIGRITEGNRTPEMKAVIKARDDYQHWLEMDFDYEEDLDCAGAPDCSVVFKQLEVLFPNDHLPF